MYRIELGEANPLGICRYTVEVRGKIVESRSRQPLLDGCRLIKSLGGDTQQYAAIYRPDREAWDLRCKVGWGATKSVREDDRAGLRLVKYQEFRR